MNSSTLNFSRLKKITASFLTWSLLASLLVGVNLNFEMPVVKAAAVASYSQNIPVLGFGELLGENFIYTIDLDNTGTPESGFRPVVELILPPEISFVSAQHTDSSMTAVTTSIVVPASLEVTNPITGEVITGLTLGDTYLVLEYPLGSIAPDQEAAGMDITLKIEATATPQVAIPNGIQTRVGFAFGEDALNNPVLDTPLYDPAGVFDTAFNFNSTEVTPLIAAVNKSISGLHGDNENATGPNHPVTYTVSAEIADGATAFPLTPFVLSDTLPDNFVIDPALGAINVSDPSGNGCTITFTPNVGAPINDGGACDPTLLGAGPFGPAGTLEISFNSISAPIANPSFDFTGYVPEFDVNLAEVIDESNGASVVVSNAATLSGDYGGSAVNDTSDAVNFTASSIAVAKSVGFAPGGDTGAAGAYQPGDTVRFSLDIDVSDYFAFDNLDLRDVIDDGYTYVNNSLQITIEEGGTIDGAFISPILFTEVNSTETNHGVFNPFDFTNCDGAAKACELAVIKDTNDDDDANGMLADGKTLLALDLSQILSSLSTGANAELAGSDTLGQQGQISITYDALIEESYIDAPPFDISIDALDSLSNTVDVTGDITSGSASGNTVSDNSSTTVTVVSPSFSKEIVAINGVAPGGGTPKVSPGDLITFEFIINIPSGDAEDISLTDYLPQPVFDAVSAPAFSFDGAKLTNATAYEVGTLVPAKNVMGFSTATTGISENYPIRQV